MSFLRTIALEFDSGQGRCRDAFPDVGVAFPQVGFSLVEVVVSYPSFIR